ncbi:hypothetical protein ANN_25060 [Periplaneta americana]|uniref:Uncharacterized protein n=1 Tax=Periplaneta americana TaxID=6978 RepID=A0ABQ8S0B4_PERAM|nr:hypothetical protein ANN_25060 [Periplaneta americana]
MFDRNDAASISNAQTLLGDPNIKAQCEYSSSNFGFILSTIDYLEKIGVKLVEEISIANLVSKVNDLQDDKCDCYELDEEMEDVKYFTYAPLVSADVERSFSAYKVILSDTRRRTHHHDTTVHDVIRLLIPALYKNQSDSLMAADGDCHHLCKLMAPVRHRWSINDVIGGIRNTVMPSIAHRATRTELEDHRWSADHSLRNAGLRHSDIEAISRSEKFTINHKNTNMRQDQEMY